MRIKITSLKNPKNLIEAVKNVRNLTKLDLTEAKEIAVLVRDGQPQIVTTFQTVSPNTTSNVNIEYLEDETKVEDGSRTSEILKRAAHDLIDAGDTDMAKYVLDLIAARK